MRTKNTVKKALGALFAGITIAAMAAPAAAQDSSLVVDGCIFWDNVGAPATVTDQYTTDSGGANCAGGAYTVERFADATVSGGLYFDNRWVNPLINPAVTNLNAPRWDLLPNSPAIAGNSYVDGHGNTQDARILKATDLNGWFDDVCFLGGVGYTGGVDAKDWTTGWTYYGYDGGLTRTDIDTTKTEVTVMGHIQSDTTWTNDTNILLVGKVEVDSLKTLTIEPGTVILGSVGGAATSYLVINRGANIDAEGSRTDPIVFTSAADFTLGQQLPGDWGGVVIHGLAVANCSNADGDRCALTTATRECVSEGNAGQFGRDNDADDSGIIRYARSEFAGDIIATDNELNAWTFNAVGSGTVIDHLQAHFGLDDMFEWFGGTARCKYLVATAGDDDNFDWQMGYHGFVQFAVMQQALGAVTTLSDAGIEADNNEFVNPCEGTSRPLFSNLTLVGASDGSGALGIRLRRGTGGVIINSIVTEFGGAGLRLENAETFNNCRGTAPSDYNCNQLAAETPVRGSGLVVAAGPNPARASANLSFELPAAGEVSVRIYDVSGKLVATLAEGVLDAGSHDLSWDAREVTPGMYFYSVRTAADEATGKLVVSR